MILKKVLKNITILSCSNLNRRSVGIILIEAPDDDDYDEGGCC